MLVGISKQKKLLSKKSLVAIKRRKALDSSVSLAIHNQKICNLKQINLNNSFVRQSGSEELYNLLSKERGYLIFVKIDFKRSPVNVVFGLLAGEGVALHKVSGFKKSAYLDSLAQRYDWLTSLLSSDSTYVLSTDNFTTYFSLLKKCFNFETVIESPDYFNFNVVCTKECKIFVNFNSTDSYLPIRSLYTAYASKENILLELSGLVGTSASTFCGSLSTELARGSSPFYPNFLGN